MVIRVLRVFLRERDRARSQKEMVKSVHIVHTHSYYMDVSHNYVLA